MIGSSIPRSCCSVIVYTPLFLGPRENLAEAWLCRESSHDVLRANVNSKRRAVLLRVRLSDVLGPERQHTRLSDDESFAGIAFDVLTLRI